MGTLSRISPPRKASALVGAAWLLALVFLGMPAGGQSILTLSAPLLLPTGISYDTQGNLYIAETNRHVIRRVDTSGVMTTVAGNGTQGFAGDGSAATSAQLDSPTGVAADAAGNLYIADTHNHRLRRVDAASGRITTIAGTGVAGFSGDGGLAAQAMFNRPSGVAVDATGTVFIADANNHRIRKVAAGTGIITTVAGDGRQGFAGDGGSGTAASVDTPSGLAVDAAGNLYLADSHNHRIRILQAARGQISTLAGTGLAGFGGDAGTAAGASLSLPRGVSVDAAGNVYIADTNNQRMRRVSPQGMITTVAGTGVQAFAGDGGLSAAASLDTPSSAAVSPAGRLTLADTGNARTRQVAFDLGVLTLTVPPALTYGAGTLTATLTVPGTASGSIMLVEAAPGGDTPLGTTALAANGATFSTAALTAGQHTLYATYAGDGAHAAVQSASAVATISPAPVTASVVAVRILYGQAVPQLTGTLQGVLTQDAGKVALQLASTVGALSPVGSYPITASLTGAGAGNYALAAPAAAVTVDKAPTTTTIAVSTTALTQGAADTVSVRVASTTSGIPGGSVAILDGAASLASPMLSATGDAAYTTSALSVGSHPLTALYAGDANFLGSAAPAQTIAVTAPVSADFTLAATGPTSQSVAAGSTASFAFAAQPQGAPLSSPILLSTSALPAGIMATFSPAYLPPGGAVTAFSLTIQTPKAELHLLPRSGIVLALLGLPCLLAGRSRKTIITGSGSLLLLLSMVGCGDRVFSAITSGAIATSVPITVSGTATGPGGVVLLHTATVTLIVQ